MAALAAFGGIAAFAVAPAGSAVAAAHLTPGNLLVSTSVWASDANIDAGSTQLPPGCGTLADDPCVTAEANGTYPIVFNNDGMDASFGVTQPIVLDELNPMTGTQVGSVEVPNSSQGLTPNRNQMVTSFSSKSEVALNQSTGGNYVTFMGYVAPVAAIDVSNSNTPGAIDPTNSGPTAADYRAVAQLDENGKFDFTETNAYSGNNGRAAILNEANHTIYMAGNAGNGNNPEPEGVVTGAGSQIMAASNLPGVAQSPGGPTPMGNFNILQLPANTKADKSAKDDNFRGLAVNGNVIYYTKGSGSNGINTVYFLDTTGAECPATGVGTPHAGATLPSAATFSSPSFSTTDAALGLTTANPGLTPTNTCVLAGFPTALAKGATDASLYPFGIWFANSTTVYVADEGAGDNAFSSTAGPNGEYTAAAVSKTAGLQKWVFNGTEWQLQYTLQGGLNLGQQYSVTSAGGKDYPTGNNSYTTVNGKGVVTTVTGPWSPGVDGLRNLTGRVNGDGTVTIWASTSTVSFSGDQGADPNALVSITDTLSNSTAAQAAGENFSTVLVPTYGQVVRGVSFTPGTNGSHPGSPCRDSNCR
ncbi:MAG: hypothetical protein ACRDZ8_08380 [Acidimicrobiales bacterium]